ncbi:hypothetical protein [Sphingomonas sp.]|jgi:hypothetical protein|uniref:hypothetical protein n=1 Tax=Sphingomonas sp. TaxID=28214 RepID=UPI0035C7A979
MGVVRCAGAGVAAALLATAGAPASAQFFLKSKDLSGAPVIGDEPGIGQPMPGATKAELEAGLVWNMRAALNVAALQCQFEPTMVTVSNYNAILTDHKDELKKSFDTLTKYFVRVNKTVKAGQAALDQFGTRTYSGFATVAAQYNFCEVANDIGRQAVFEPRGRFADVARLRMRELRNSLTPWGDQAMTRSVYPTVTLPRVDAICWSKKGEWQDKKCGALVWPPVGVATAQR